MILDLLKFFARYPRKSGVLENFKSSNSSIAHYDALRAYVDSLNDDGLMPGIQSFIFGVSLDDVKHRVESAKGMYIMVDYGDIHSEHTKINSIEDTASMAVTLACKVPSTLNSIEKALVADQTLSAISELRVRIEMDNEAPSFMTSLSKTHQIVPFISGELHSIGWTLMYTFEGSDLLNFKQIKNQLQ